MNKKILMLFSGGIDSTYLMYKNIAEGNEVYYIHNIIKNNLSQTSKELKAIRDIVSWMKCRFFDCKLNGIDDFMEFTVNDCGMFFVQPHLWLTSLAIYLQSITDVINFDEIQYGIIARDDALSFIDDLKNIFDASMMMPETERYRGKLTFPLIKYQKSHLIDKLPEELLQLTTSCEYNCHSKFCNECHSCKTLQEAFRPSCKDLNTNELLNTKEEIKEYKNETKNL